ncbi:FG-GAP repeat domain-containing protein [Streptomyces sp. NPDC001774]
MSAGTLATAPSAFAAGPFSASTDQSAASLPVYPEHSELGGAGSSGFLTYSFANGGTRNLLWTPYDGGASTQLQEPEDGGFTVGGDVVVLGDAGWTLEMRAVTLRNMAAPAAPAVSIDLGALNGTYVTVLSPTSVLAQITEEDGTAALYVVTKGGSTTTTRKIAGLPADATEFSASAVKGGTVLVGYGTGPADERAGGRALIDVATGTVTQTYASVESGHDFTTLMFSGSHVAWLDYSADTGLYVTSVDRKTGETKQTRLGSRYDEWHYQLVGGWLVFGNRGTSTQAVSLTDGETRDLGIVAWTSASSPDGSAVLQGNQPPGPETLFRVAAATDGVTVSKVAEPGEPVMALGIGRVQVPDVAELDKTSGRVTLDWTLTRADAYLDVTLTHLATGRKFKQRVTAPAIGTRFSLVWKGEVEGEGGVDVGGPNGVYAVDAEARLTDGSGEPVRWGASMNLVRTYNAHDYNDNGSTDVFARDGSGKLWRSDLRDRPYYGEIRTVETTSVGAGWGVYKQIEAVGSVGGAVHGDLVAVDGSGVQWLYLGKGDGTFAARTKVGTGWQIYNKIAGGSDLDGDGRPDLTATDGAGVLWFYKGTGNYSKPFAPRVKVGGGWQIYNHLTAVGDIAGTAAGDLVARDTAGVLWLYQGNGRGGFSARVKVGPGWGSYSQLVGAGDLDNDGRPDLIAYGTSGEYSSYFYSSTGVAAIPFTRRAAAGLFRYEGSRYSSIA